MKFLICLLLAPIVFFSGSLPPRETDTNSILSYEVNPAGHDLRFFLKDQHQHSFQNIGKLKQSLDSAGLELVFAMNGGMFTTALLPQGLFVEGGKLVAKTDTLRSGYGNFYMQPNGIFYLTRAHQAVVCTTSKFVLTPDIQYATQSGPMLVIDGAIHPKFSEGSKNVNIRNGMGILPNGNMLFAISKEKINFYDFAMWFKKRGCRNALYLDGFVSKVYLPAEKIEQVDGTLGVIIGEVKKKGEKK
ncbi:phosphodiester glycosidase family protein [Chryseolinea lacunae]|uniref:Phosphodiester glycosidase family protein n=1 Tax=Chryseolinea lacunae TaxID=2801331 RepID=A0ABS1KT47_9BACT|nr:phosphodiester glycosidase family protein [Chryseolinea lacunae]MBL0742599.1 phosphodiester glycosidase family protein [Chryseolinea lacunae]